MQNTHNKLHSVLFSLALAMLFCFTSAASVPAAPAHPPLIQLNGSKAAQPAQQGQQAPLQTDKDSLLRQTVPSGMQNYVPPLITQSKVRLASFLEFYLDPEFADINEIAAQQDKFQIFTLDRISRSAAGTLWLRFILPQAQDGSAQTPLVLELGPSVPGTPVLYTPALTEEGTLEWKEHHPSGSIIALPPASAVVPLVCYLRVDGIPGPWFSPAIKTMESVAAGTGSWQNIDLHLAGMAALATLFAACLFSGLINPGQWRFWVLLYLACALAHSWAGQPSPETVYTAKSIAALCCGGLAVMIWPLAGRSMMLSKKASKTLDASLILLCLAGAALTILPLVPQLKWICRYVDLWPAALVIFIPSALWGCAVGAPNSFKFLLGTIIPPIVTALAYVGIQSNFTPELLASLPMFGVALGILIVLSLTQTPYAADLDIASDFSDAPSSSNSSSGLSLEPQKADSISLQMTEDRAPQPMAERTPAPSHKLECTEQGCQALLKSLETELDKKHAALPAPFHKSLDSLIDKTREILIELQDLEQKAASAKHAAQLMNIVVISKDPGFCAVLSHVLRPEECNIRQTNSLEGAVQLARAIPARLYIFQGDYADTSSGSCIAALRRFKPACGGDPVFLAYTPDESTWRLLAKAGFTHALVLPIDDVAIINTIKELKEESKESRANAASQPAAEEGPVPDLFGKAPAQNSSAADAPLTLSPPAEKPARKAPDADEMTPIDLGAPLSTPQKPQKRQDSNTLSDIGTIDLGAPLQMPAAEKKPSPVSSSFDIDTTLEFVSPFPTAESSLMSPKKASSALPGALVRELTDGLALMKHALSNVNLPALVNIAQSTSEKAAHYPSFAKLCQLIAKAAASSDTVAAGELLQELADAIERKKA